MRNPDLTTMGECLECVGGIRIGAITHIILYVSHCERENDVSLLLLLFGVSVGDEVEDARNGCKEHFLPEGILGQEAGHLLEPELLETRARVQEKARE